MKRTEFADLAGITPAMVTKYQDQGLIVFASPKIVDPRATLAALAGRLDEHKRQAALAKLDAAQRIAANDATPAQKPARSAKVEIDELKRDTLALELARKAGELVPIEEVERVILDAIAGLQAAFDQESRAMAAQLTIDLGLSPHLEATVSRRLRTLCNRARQRFAADMLTLAGAEFEPPADEDAAESAAPPQSA